MTARECAHLGTKSSAPRPRATLAETANTASAVARDEAGAAPHGRGRGNSPTDEAGAAPHGRGRGDSPTDEAGAALPRTRPGRLPEAWHVRFRGNLSATLPKVACNSVDRTFLITQKRWNCNDTISIHKRLTGKLHATLLGNHDDSHTRSGHDQDRSRNMRTRNRRLGPLVQHPPPPPPGRHHTTTNRKSTHNNTKGSGLNKPPQNPGFDTPAKGHCTRYVALHPLRRAAPVTSRCTRYVALHPLRRAAPEQKGCNAYTSGAMPTHRVQCLHIGCTTPRHKLRCGPARMEVDGSARLGCARRRRTPHNQQRPAATHPQTANRARRQRTPDSQPGPAAQSKQLAGPGGAVQTAGWARGRQGLAGLRDDAPSGRAAAHGSRGV